MSVINTMLKDLEQREGQTLSGRYLPPAQSRLRWVLAGWLLALVGIPVLAYMLWHLWLDKPSQGVTSAPPVATSPAAVQAAPAPVVVTPASVPASSAVATAAPMTVAAPVVATESAAPRVVVKSATPVVPATIAPGTIAPGTIAPATVGTEAKPPMSSNSTTLATPAAVAPDATTVAAAPSDQTLDDALLGPDEGPRLTEAAQAAAGGFEEPMVEPQGSLDITEEHLSPHEEAALDRRKGLQAVAKGQLDVARDAFSRVLANEPTDHEIRERLAGLLYGDGRVPEAQQLLEEGIRLAPARADFRLMQARLALSTGNKAQALQSLSGWEPPVASNLDYYATRAALAQELSQTSLAASSYRLLTQAQPAEARWWLGLGISLDKQGRPQAALEAYRKALGLPLSAGSRHFVQQRIGQLE